MAGARYIGAMNQFRHRGVTRISRLPPLAATRCARACGRVTVEGAGDARATHRQSRSREDAGVDASWLGHATLAR